MTYTEGNYYKGLGIYIGTRTTYFTDHTNITEHLFNQGTYDRNGAANLKRIKIK
jgi:hypothetical protein